MQWTESETRRMQLVRQQYSSLISQESWCRCRRRRSVAAAPADRRERSAQSAARAAHRAARPQQSRRESCQHLRIELQFDARRAVLRGLRKQGSARDASAGRHSTATGRVQRQRTRHVAVAIQRVSPERHGHTARVFDVKRIRRKARQLAGGTESQRQRVARDAPPADRREGMAVLRAEWLASARRRLKTARIWSCSECRAVRASSASTASAWPKRSGGSARRAAATRSWRCRIEDQSVRVYRLRGDRLEELARTQLKGPCDLLWLADRLLVGEWDAETKSHAVAELALSGTRLERRRELIASSARVYIRRWTAVNNGLAIFEWNKKELLHYQFA